MNCGLCKAEARLVDLGREMGPPYFYCGECKLEQKEWEARVSPKLEAVSSAPRVTATEALERLENIQFPPTYGYWGKSLTDSQAFKAAMDAALKSVLRKSFTVTP